MDLLGFYSDSAIRDLIGKYLDSDDIRKRFEKSVDDLKSMECLIPVLGTQGSGKSSFLNAVLFGDILLPVDADETTCVPTVIRYGESSAPEATVVLSSVKRESVPCSEAGLSDYVHQEKNPGNAKGVACIEIAVKSDLLKGGIAFVDLPGVGSVTAANQKTTTEYLQRCTAAIFMLRTVPPITQSESVFIQGALPLMGRVFWVQNQWTDESKDEVNEGRAHNHRVIQDVAARLNLPKSSVAESSVVCVKRALDGRVEGNAKKVAESGIEAFREDIVAFARDWRKEIVAGKKSAAIDLLAAAEAGASWRHERLSGDVGVERAKIDEERQKTAACLESNAKLVRMACDFLDGQKGDVDSLIASECRKFAENLRNEVRNVIDNGLVDDMRLQKAYSDILKKKCLPTLFETLQPKFLNMAHQLQEMLAGLQDVDDTAKTLNVAGATARLDSGGFSKKETASQSVYGVVGAAGGAAVGAAIGSVVPILGTVIGGVLGGLLGGFFGGFGGDKLRQIRLEQQKEASRRELFALVAQEERARRELFSSALSDMTEKLDYAIRDWLRNQKDVVDARHRKAIADLSKSAEERAAEANAVKEDAAQLASLRKELEAL